MSDKIFVPRSDLDKMSEAERGRYYLDACEYFQVPPELNVLYFTYFDTGDGARTSVLAAKKGATDIIRDRLGIDVIELTDKVINGSIVFNAKGRNAKGRLEMASGAKYIEGLKGQELDSAIMTAQTRAVKRMTLQFAGGGLLDESEVPHSVTVDIAKAAARPAEQPKVKAIIDAAMGNTQPLDITPAQEAARAALAHVKPEALAKAADEPITSIKCGYPGVQAILQESAAPKRRTRQKPVEMDTPFSLDGTVPTPLPPVPPMPKLQTLVEEAKKFESLTPVLPSNTGSLEPALSVGPEVVKAVIDNFNERKPVPILNVPAEAQMKAYRDKLFTYTNIILPKAGMVPTENIGGSAMKVRLFAQAKFGVVLNQLSVEQWEAMFKLFESTTPAELVKLIDETAIGMVKK